MSEKASREAIRILINLGVKVILNDRVEIPPGMDKFKAQKVVSEKGVEIEYDAVYMCVGAKPNTSLVRECFPEWLDDKGFIQVFGNK